MRTRELAVRLQPGQSVSQFAYVREASLTTAEGQRSHSTVLHGHLHEPLVRPDIIDGYLSGCEAYADYVDCRGLHERGDSNRGLVSLF